MLQGDSSVIAIDGTLLNVSSTSKDSAPNAKVDSRRIHLIMNVIRIVGAIVAAIVVALVLLIAVEFFSAVVHPTPEDFGGSMEEMCEHVAKYPAWVLAVVVPMWGATAFISTWVAKRTGGGVAAIVIALLFITAVLFNISKLPYPMWFKLIIVPVVAGAAAVPCLGRSKRLAPATEEGRGATGLGEASET